MAIVGESHRISRTLIVSDESPIIIRAYVERLSRYLRWPSAYRVSNAREDFHEPETPVTTTREFFGMVTSIFLRLCVCAPRIIIFSDIVHYKNIGKMYWFKRKNQFYSALLIWCQHKGNNLFCSCLFEYFRARIERTPCRDDIIYNYNIFRYLLSCADSIDMRSVFKTIFLF